MTEAVVNIGGGVVDEAAMKVTENSQSGGNSQGQPKKGSSNSGVLLRSAANPIVPELLTVPSNVSYN